ncbi:MAG TPA: DUF5615 family PIN-like protein [Planctomycetaceae bacterium]
MIRFHLDENVPAAIGVALAARRYDVTTAASAGLREATDAEHLAFALADGRVTVTQDADFLRLHAQGTPHAGIAYVGAGRGLGEIVRGLVLIAECLTPDDMRGHVEFV